jgi:hypothetical protein
MKSPRTYLSLSVLVLCAGCGSTEDMNEGGTDATTESATDGTIDVRDGSSDSDADGALDGPTSEGGGLEGGLDGAIQDGGIDASCANHTYDGGMNIFNMTCSRFEKYKCGVDTYDISCMCYLDGGADAGSDCACRKNQQMVAAVNAAGCPSCSFNMSSVAIQCGIPY